MNLTLLIDSKTIALKPNKCYLDPASVMAYYANFSRLVLQPENCTAIFS